MHLVIYSICFRLLTIVIYIFEKSIRKTQFFKK